MPTFAWFAGSSPDQCLDHWLNGDEPLWQLFLSPASMSFSDSIFRISSKFKIMCLLSQSSERFFRSTTLLGSGSGLLPIHHFHSDFCWSRPGYWLKGRYWLLLWRKDNVLLEHLLVLWVFAISLWNRWIRGVTVAFLTLDPVTLGKYYHFSLVFHFQMYLLLLCLNLYYMDYNEINWIWGNGDKFHNTFFPESHLVASASGDGTEMGVAPPHGRVFKSLLFGHWHDIHHRLLFVF